MARARHAMRVHPLRSKGVIVGVPVAAAVAFGAHSVLGVTPLSDQQDAPTTASASPSASAPVQSYGLATTPPPTTLDLLSAPASHTPAATGPAAPASAQTAEKTTTTRIVADRAPAGPTSTVPIAAPAPATAVAAPAPSMMTFAGGDAAQPQVQQAVAQQAAPQQRTAEPAEEAQPSSGGSLLGLDLGVGRVSVLSFGQ